VLGLLWLLVTAVLASVRRECLDHLIVLNGQHLASVLAEFVPYYNREQPHHPRITNTGTDAAPGSSA
jgi:hypothetical protein